MYKVGDRIEITVDLVRVEKGTIGTIIDTNPIVGCVEAVFDNKELSGYLNSDWFKVIPKEEDRKIVLTGIVDSHANVIHENMLLLDSFGYYEIIELRSDKKKENLKV